MNLINEIQMLKRKKKALLLVHNYQRPEIQDTADYLGDSIELCKNAMDEKKAEILVLSAVDFMAESAAILNPDKRVLIPSLGARCPMAQMLTAEQVGLWKKKHPGAPVILYVNTLAEAKAACDICCTSANAVRIVNSFDEDTVLFGPDANLAWHVQQETGKKVIPIPSRGCCPTHILFTKGDVQLSREMHPEAVVMVHPECTPEVQLSADFVGSTSQMLEYAAASENRQFIVATEEGFLHPLQERNPRKQFYATGSVCSSMRLTTLGSIRQALDRMTNVVEVPEEVRGRAAAALERMLAV